MYRHHLEQVYKLCRPCQAAVEHYLKHQNRQLRALLLSHQFQRRDADRSRMQVCSGLAGVESIPTLTGWNILANVTVTGRSGTKYPPPRIPLLILVPWQFVVFCSQPDVPPFLGTPILLVLLDTSSSGYWGHSGPGLSLDSRHVGCCPHLGWTFMGVSLVLEWGSLICCLPRGGPDLSFLLSRRDTDLSLLRGVPDQLSFLMWAPDLPLPSPSLTHSLCLCPQSFGSFAVKSPVQVIMLRALAFLACAFLLTTLLYGSGDPFTPGPALPPALPPGGNGSSAAAADNSSSAAESWRQLLGLLPEPAAEKLRVAWTFGQRHQMAVVALGLFTCLLAMLLAGRLRYVYLKRGPLSRLPMQKEPLDGPASSSLCPLTPCSAEVGGSG